MDRGPELKNSIPCEAILDWPLGKEMCWEPAVFQVERVADTDMAVCARHLGPILQHTHNVVWPPGVSWIGPGERPRKALARGGPEAEERERKVFGS